MSALLKPRLVGRVAPRAPDSGRIFPHRLFQSFLGARGATRPT